MKQCNCETEKQKPFRYFMSLKRPIAGGESCKQEFFLGAQKKNYLISIEWKNSRRILC